MEIVPLNCDHCGAPLQVGESTRFVTCRHCDSRLAIKHTAGAAYTEVLDELRNAQRETADELDTFRLQYQLDQLDREWAEKSGIIDTGRGESGPYVPNPARGCASVFVSLAFATVVLSAILQAQELPVPAIVFLLILLVVLAISIVRVVTGTDSYSVAEKNYLERREALLAELAHRDVRRDREGG